MLCPNPHTRVGHQLLVSQLELVDAAFLQTSLLTLIDKLHSYCIKTLILKSLGVGLTEWQEAEHF